MKSSLIALLTAATLSFASMGAVYAQEAATPAAGTATEDCVPGDAAVAPDSLAGEDNDNGADGAVKSTDNTTTTVDASGTPSGTASTCCTDEAGATPPAGTDADCPAVETKTN